jgi:hypothetical protein
MNIGQPQEAAEQQPQADRGIKHRCCDADPAPPRHARDQQRDDRRDQQPERRIDPPALRLGIEAIGELPQPGADEHPARPVGIAGLAAVAAPGRLHDRPIDEGRHREIQEDGAHRRDRDVQRR